MKLLKLVSIVVCTTIIYSWVNDCGSPLRLAELLPFSRSAHHSFAYNYASIVMIGLTIYGVIVRAYAQRSWVGSR